MSSLQTDRSSNRLPLIVYGLGAVIVLVGTSEFMIAGLLPDLASDLHTSVSHAGLLITGFAVGMLLGAPAMAVLTLRLPRRITLGAALAVFAAGHVLSALVDSFAVQLVARFVTAVATGTFWSVAAVIVTSVIPAALRSRGMSILIGGLTISNVAGVPLGTFVGQHLGWRVTFWLLAGGAVLAAALLLPRVPATGAVAGHRTDVRSELSAFRNRQLWLTLAVIAVLQVGVFGAFSYVSPLVTDAAGLSEGLVPVVLILFGVGALIGAQLGGRFGDRRNRLVVVVGIVAAAVVLALLALLGDRAPAAIALPGLLGVAGFATAPALTGRLMGLAGEARTLASATGTSAFNVGNALGPWLGGIVLAAHGPLAPPVLGAIAAAAALVVFTVGYRRVEPAPVAIARSEPVGTTEPAAVVEAPACAPR